MSRRWGRIFNGHLIPPVDEGSIVSLYLALRMFVGDNFYFTTKLLSYCPFCGNQFDPKIAFQDSINKNKISREVEKMKELIEILAEEVKKNDAQLYIAGYPCLYKRGCLEVNYTFNELKETLKQTNINVKVLDADSECGAPISVCA